MWIRRFGLGCGAAFGLGAAVALALAPSAHAQGAAQAAQAAEAEAGAVGAGEAAPLSAIDWLSDTVARPREAARGGETDISQNALPDAVTTQPLGRASPDEVGILSVSMTGLPRGLWGTSASRDLARRIGALTESDMLPASRDFLVTLLLSELAAPLDSDPDQPLLFLARIDTLLAMGQLDQAEALMDRAGVDSPEVFRRWFDTRLLLGSEHRACALLRDTPELSPTFPARIFCLARGGDWDAAALTLQTASALGHIDEDTAELLARFLDPELFEGEAPLPVPSRPSPLEFRMFEAIGEPLPTARLPLAFAHADLRANQGWKFQLEAAERLARTGAVAPNRLIGIMTRALPAASGGIWNRVEAIQRLDVAMTTGDPGAVSLALPFAWDAMEDAEIEVPFAHLYGAKLAHLPLREEAHDVALGLGLLSADYEAVARRIETPRDAREAVLLAIALGDEIAIDDQTPRDPILRAVIDGLGQEGVPTRLRSLVDSDRLGEALLRAIALLESGAHGDFDELADAIGFLRAVGLEDLSRRVSLQLLLLERRG